MQPDTNEKYIVGLEIGSSRAKIGIAGFDPEDDSHTLTVYNTASAPTVDSVRYGRITNIREVTDIVNSLLENVEKRPPIDNRNILGVFISIGGRSLKAVRTSARIVLPNRREITEDIVERVRDEAISNLSTPLELICVEPTRFNIDNAPAPRPVGSLGTRIAGEFTAVLCNQANKCDIIDVVSERIGLNVCGISVRPIALAHLVLSPQETNAGCMLVDFGAETITVAIYKNYALQYLATIPLGSRLITRDLATALALTEENAEDVKIALADAMPDGNTPEGMDDRMMKSIDQIVDARLADIIANIAAQPEFAGMTKDMLPAGIILTGGGAKLRNFGNLLDNTSRMKVRVATLPADIIIRDANLSAADNLDLIALLNEGAEAARLNADIECLSAATTQAQHPDDTDKNTVQPDADPSSTTNTDDIVLNIETGEFIPATEQPVTPANVRDLNEWGYDPAEFTNYGNATAIDESDSDDSLLDDDPDDGYNLMDDDEVDEDRRRRAKRIAAANERKIKARIEKEKREMREKQRIDREKQRQENPSRMDKIINRITGFLSNSGEDHSGDMDD